MPACPACAQENPDIARFCLSCGLSLAPTQRPSEERRVVSVIFVDLVGFTSRAERLDPEDVRSVLSMYYQRVRAEIESFGGVVEKFIGDAVMGLFGARTSYGDDPERAVRSALAVLDGVAELNAEHSGLDLEARVAVNTGEALVSLAPEDGQTMVAGDVVNTASRLQQAAPVNGILVGAETYRATREVITYEDVAPVVAKGKSAPVRAWRVLAAPRQPGERKTADTPMVDRLGELRLLREAWERVVGDSALHVVTVFGPPGIGKSRLGREFERFASGAGGRAVIGRCLPYRDSGAYGAFATQVKELAGIFDSDPVDAALEKLRTTVTELLGEPEGREVATHLAVLLGFEVADDVVERDSLFFSVRCFVEAVAAERPLLLGFEDLHWADTALLDLVEFLSTRLRDLPVLVLAMARPELLDARPTWGTGLPAHLALTLAPLGPADAVELAGYLLGPAAEAEREHQASLITVTAEGNPLFLEQLAAALTEHSAGEAAALPTTIRGIVTARLDALPSEERALLVSAAVVGRVFWRGVLGAADATTVGRLLGALESRDLIHRERSSIIEGEQQFAFKHGLIRDVAYETLPRALRRERHAEVAQFLEQAGLTGAEAAARLGRHWREGGRPDRAVDYFLTAADQAGHGWAKDRAALLYGEALACLPDHEEQQRHDIRRRQALAAAAAFHVADARQLTAEPQDAAIDAGPEL